jgi:hypothetical protein
MEGREEGGDRGHQSRSGRGTVMGQGRGLVAKAAFLEGAVEGTP